MLSWVTNSWIKENTFWTYTIVFLSQSIAFLVYKTHCYSLLSSCLQRFWKQTSFFAELSIFKWVINKIHRYKNAILWAKIIKMAWYICSDDFNRSVYMSLLCMLKGQSSWIDSRPNIDDDHWKHGQKRRWQHNSGRNWHRVRH